MSRKIYDVNVYPGADGGFDVIIRLRGGFQKVGDYPTIEAALSAARTVEGKDTRQPVYVYDRSLSDMMAGAITTAIERMAQKGGEA